MKRKRFSALIASMVMVASMAAVPFSASAATTYTAVTGSKQENGFYKYLVLDKDATVPTATFSYTIEPIDNDINYISPDGAKTTIAAYKGVTKAVSGVTYPKIEDVSFAAGNTTTAGAADDGITNSADKKYVKTAFTVDFSNVEFTEPGVYRYTVTETNAGATDNLGAGIAHVGNYAKTLDVYVTDNNGTLEVSSYVLYNNVLTDPPALAEEDDVLNPEVDRTDTENNDKTDGFVNEYSSQDLTIGKEVTGNQGSKDKYFKFTVTIENAKGANLTIDTSNSNFDKEPAKNSATIYTAELMKGTEESGIIGNGNSVDQNTSVDGQQLVISGDTATYDFYLQNGQYITLLGLPKGATYTVTEAAEEYTSKAAPEIKEEDTVKGFTIGSKTFKDVTTGTIDSADVLTGFSNEKTGTVPTGVLLSVAAPAVVGIIVIGGIAFLILKNKRREAEEE